MKIKIYAFNYSKFSDRLGNGFFSFFTNLAIPIVSFYMVAIAMSLSGVIQHIGIEYMMALLGFSIILGIIFALKFCFGFKGITLYNHYMEITTQTLGLGKSKPKIQINYSDIASVYNSTFNLRYDRRKARRTFIAGDLSNYVELTLRGGKQFCFSVSDQKECIEEIIERVNVYRKKNNLEEL